MRVRVLAVSAALVLVGTACAIGAPSDALVSITPGVQVPGEGVAPIFAGTLELPAAVAFGDPGFHQVLTFQGTVADAPAAGPVTIVLSLVDATRPSQTCSQEHPLSGCATVDWSDDPTRPGTPDSGVFDNRITVRLADREHDLYLTPEGNFREDPNLFEPG